MMKRLKAFHKMALDHVRTKASSTEDELNGLKAWRTSMEKMLACSEQVRGELGKQTELLRQDLEDKEKEIKDAKDQLLQAKEVAICKYCDSDTLLVEPGTLFAEGFDDALRQVKLLILIWTCPMLLLKSRTNQQLSLSF